jgi:hypothetical protein
MTLQPPLACVNYFQGIAVSESYLVVVTIQHSFKKDDQTIGMLEAEV